MKQACASSSKDEDKILTPQEATAGGVPISTLFDGEAMAAAGWKRFVYLLITTLQFSPHHAIFSPYFVSNLAKG